MSVARPLVEYFETGRKWLYSVDAKQLFSGEIIRDIPTNLWHRVNKDHTLAGPQKSLDRSSVETPNLGNTFRCVHEVVSSINRKSIACISSFDASLGIVETLSLHIQRPPCNQNYYFRSLPRLEKLPHSFVKSVAFINLTRHTQANHWWA